MSSDAEAPSAPRARDGALVPEPPIPSNTSRDASDGRVALRLRNRQRVIDGLIELVDEGDISPSMEAIVERSGVSERSIFRYFNDLADLSVSAVRVVVERAAPLHVIENLGEGTLEHRINESIAARLRVAERTHTFGALARQRLAFTPEIREALSKVIVNARARFSAQFAPELDAMSADDATVVLDVLIALFSYESLDVLWHQLGNDHEAVAERWRVTMTALLSPRS